MAYIDELQVGDGVTVTSEKGDVSFHGKVEELRPSPDSYSSATHDRVRVRYDDDETIVSVHPRLLTLDEGEAVRDVG